MEMGCRNRIQRKCDRPNGVNLRGDMMVVGTTTDVWAAAWPRGYDAHVRVRRPPLSLRLIDDKYQVALFPVFFSGARVQKQEKAGHSLRESALIRSPGNQDKGTKYMGEEGSGKMGKLRGLESDASLKVTAPRRNPIMGRIGFKPLRPPKAPKCRGHSKRREEAEKLGQTGSF